MSYPSKDDRQKCWDARDLFWDCLEKNAPKHSSTSGEDVPSMCRKHRKVFETGCPTQWVKHFDRKRTYEQFKKKMDTGYDPLQSTNSS